MSRLVLLLEEPSMKALLDGLLPRLFPSLRFLCVPHEGRDDLEKSIRRKLQAWREPGVRFAIVRDNDRGDCQARKRRLRELCGATGRDDTLVRIACQELGGVVSRRTGCPGRRVSAGIAAGHPTQGPISRFGCRAAPGARRGPSGAGVSEVSGARRMAQHLSLERNRSTSFHAFMNGVDAVLAEMTAREA